MVILASFYLIILLHEYFTGLTNALKCMHYKSSSDFYGNSVQLDNGNIKANNNDNKNYNDNNKPEDIIHRTCNGYCYSLWRYDPYDLFNTSRYQLISSGCSDGNNYFRCNKLHCTSSLKTLETLNNTSFCCCYGDMCNTDYSINLIDELLDSNGNFKEDYKNYMIFLIFVCIIFFTFTLISAKLVRSIYSNDKITNQKTTDSLHLLESQSVGVAQKSPALFLKDYMENLNLIEIIGNGKYGSIWKGKLNDTIVTVKVCLDSNKKHLWANECHIYSLPFMNHPNLPNFYCNIDRLTENGHVEHCLVIEYGHYGSLQSYLTEHTFDWSRMCQLFKSLVKGLAYLHTEIRKEGKVKPSIAHCDLCSANIIVKADGTCMICDFQSAVRFTNGVSSTKSEGRLGTIRYLAPEILNGAINIWQSESSLKQADIYALGLILWEIATRCIDLYQGIDVPRYKLPFEHEVGLTPSLDQMKLLVNRHKARPLFLDIWKDSNYAIRLLKETISECWDHEPEARLTALCIEERISELPLLWKRHKMETLSNCYVIALLQENSKNPPIEKMNTINECDLSENDKENVNYTKSYPSHEKLSDHEYSNNVCYINKFENSLHCKYNDYKHLLHHPQHRHYFHQISLNNTKKHHLNINIEKNFNINLKNNQPKLTLPLQPHHARNPCMERNLMINETDERDEILEQGLKFKNQNYTEINPDALGIEPESNDIHNGDINYSENRSLIQTPMPIPFVKNYVNNVSEVSSSSIKIKDINKYRNSPHRHFFKQNFINFLRRKFNLDLFKSSPNKTETYNNCHENRENNKTIYPENMNYSIPLNSKDTLPINDPNNESALNSSSTMISLEENYPFSTMYESLSTNRTTRKEVQEQTADNNKLNNHHQNMFHCCSGKQDHVPFDDNGLLYQ